MLRVYSVLYIERLWNDEPAVSHQKHLIRSSNSSTHSQIIVTDAYTTRGIQADDGAATAHEQNDDEDEQGDNQESPEEAPLQAAPTLVQIPEATPADAEMVDGKLDSETSVDSAVPQQPQEHIINSLAIDTNNLQDYPSSSSSSSTAAAAAADAQAKAQAEVMSITTTIPVTAVAERSADHAPTSISSSSSILPPLTPSSVHSIGGNDAFEKPRTTSLIRRETQKINDRRKSLTKKIKRVLTVKSENKRNSV
ncbi:alpha-1,4-glucan branching enzyme [Mucor velutinosus]|uniref:Alpha-1,4-glucan branching enzyme n=1 Tax=Mucor velutinosus TaxID=708070 RepID=A0AAN7HNR0_9FUNG|nr:alpha-1,4-glucan branching enzyme [Mucor velutinosus]